LHPISYCSISMFSSLDELILLSRQTTLPSSHIMDGSSSSRSHLKDMNCVIWDIFSYRSTFFRFDKQPYLMSRNQRNIQTQVWMGLWKWNLDEIKNKKVGIREVPIHHSTLGTQFVILEHILLLYLVLF